MKAITTKPNIVDLLFKRLRRSEPQHVVSANFLLLVSGVCYGLAWRGSDNPLPYLAHVLAGETTGPVVSCGAKLIEFARSLARAGLLENPQGCSTSRLIRLMLEALDDDGLRIRKKRKLACSYVISTPAFARVNGVKVKVRLGSLKTKSRVLAMSGPTDLLKLKAAERRAEWDAMKEELALLRTTKAVMAQEVSRLDDKLLRAHRSIQLRQERLDFALQRVSALQDSLSQSQEQVRSLQQELSPRSHATGNPAYRRVGLAENCPEFLLKAARRAYRQHYHPDPRPPHEKVEAEQKFKEAEGVFDTLYNLRQLS
jgi:hypothetical protein